MSLRPNLPSHIPALDVVRGIAILAVLGYHTLDASYGANSLPFSGWWPDWRYCTRSFLAFYPLTLGWAGVSLFFIASGFSIHYSAMRRPDRHTTWIYLQKRFWRIAPAYLVSLAVFARLGPWPAGYRSWNFWSHATTLYAFDPSVFFGINPSYWSLAVEWHIYLLYPLLVLCRKSMALLVPLFAVSLASQAVAGYAGLGGLASATLANSILVNTAHWWLGTVLAERFIAGRRLFRASWVLPLAVFWVFSTQCAPLTTFSKSTAAIACAAFTEQLVWGTSGGRVARLLGFVGLVSYSLYLWHQPILAIVAGHVHGHPAVRFAALLACWIPLLVLATASYFAIEKLGISLGKRLRRGD